jgi:pyruvate/2-oxoglutarate dehydrogenase complex dihydrolipoamide acyltransferase (E2) component
MTRNLKATVAALAIALATTAAAQTTVTHRHGTVVGKYDNKLVVATDKGNVELPVAAGSTILIDGKPTGFDDIKLGTVLDGDVVRKTTTTEAKSTEIKNAKVIKVAGQILYVEGPDGFKSYDVPVGYRFLVDGKEVPLDKLYPGMKLTATIVHKQTATLTSTEIQNLTGKAPAAPAPAPAPAAVAPAPAPAAPAPAAAPEPAPEPKKLPKTASPLPLVALGGAFSLAAGLGLRLRRREA